MKYGLSDETISKIQQVFLLVPEIEQVILYGSRAMGNFKNGSDIDIVVIGNKIDDYVINKISWLLDDLLLPYTFDIANYNQIKNTELLEHITRVGCTLYPEIYDSINK